MSMRRIAVGIFMLGSFALPAHGGDAARGSDEPIPVLWQAPACTHEKLGPVSIKDGTEVSSRTVEAWVAPASYERAFARLGEAAAGRGGNAVVLRMHEATFYTRGRKRSRRPVLVQLKGAAITVPAHGCELEVVDPQMVLERALRGEPVEMPPDLTASSAS